MLSSTSSATDSPEFNSLNPFASILFLREPQLLAVRPFLPNLLWDWPSSRSWTNLATSLCHQSFLFSLPLDLGRIRAIPVYFPPPSLSFLVFSRQSRVFNKPDVHRIFFARVLPQFAFWRSLLISGGRKTSVRSVFFSRCL